MANQLLMKLAALSALFVATACGPTSGETTDGNETTASSQWASVTATGVDYSWSRPSPSGLHAQGYTFAARYLSHDTSGKNLSHAEAAALWAAGVDVVANWESTANSALNGHAQGVADAQAAESLANAYGIPSGRPIYFSVDFDATQAEQTPIDAYFDGVASVIGVARTGAYGGYYVVKRLFDAGKIKWGWQTYAWSGGQWDSRAQLRQVQNGITAAGDANCCDKDEAVAIDYGQWHAVAPNAPPRGYLDGAACAKVAGWAQDPDAPATTIDVDLYFDGPVGSAGSESMRVLAADKRTDLCTSIGSCNHGFAFNMPLGMLDGKAHPIHAYGIDTHGGTNPELADSPKTFQCPNATPPFNAHSGVKRHVLDAATMTAWSFSRLVDVAPEPDSVIAAYPQGEDWSKKPALIQADDGSPEVWLLDGKMRRHVVSGASLVAWHRTVAEVVKTPAAKVNGIARGPDLPATPFLVIGSGPAVYVLDVAPATPPGPPGASDGGTPSGDSGSPTDDAGDAPANADSGASGGCSLHATSPTSGLGWTAIALPLLVFARRRRRTARS